MLIVHSYRRSLWNDEGNRNQTMVIKRNGGSKNRIGPKSWIVTRELLWMSMATAVSLYGVSRVKKSSMNPKKTEVKTLCVKMPESNCTRTWNCPSRYVYVGRWSYRRQKYRREWRETYLNDGLDFVFVFATDDGYREIHWEVIGFIHNQSNAVRGVLASRWET